MSRTRGRTGAVAAVLLAACATLGAEARCKTVNGHISSEVVTVFSNGDPCPSPVGICSEGRFVGGLNGKFTFVAQALAPVQTVDPASPVTGVAFTTGDIRLETKCGSLVLRDASVFSLEADGQFGSLQTVDGGASEGECAGASGRLRVYGVFMGGCVACDYRGEVCTP